LGFETSEGVAQHIHVGKTLFVPRIDKAADKMDFLEVYGEEDLLNLPSGVWGIREPLETYDGRPRLNGKFRPSTQLSFVEHVHLALDEQCEGLDMILMPGLS
jgi:5-formyltetrahydrofolate cyclo-ligase